MGLLETPNVARPGGKPRTWGEWQRAEREERKWTQRHLAQASGVSERSLKRYEAGGSPRGEEVWLILSAFGFPVPESAPRAVNAELADLVARSAEMQSAVDRLVFGMADLHGRIDSIGGGDAE